MTGTMGPVLVRIEQRATAAAKDYRVRCGFRPALIQWFRGSNDAAGMGFWMDGNLNSSTAHSGNPTKGVFGATGTLGAIDSGGITAHDDGFTFGQDGSFKSDGAILWFVVHRTMFPIETFDLADVKKYSHDYGTGKQFEKDGLSSAPVEVFEA